MDIKEVKIKIRKWLDDFEIKHNRPPKGNDIKLAPVDIKELYKIYNNHKVNKSVQSENVDPNAQKPTQDINLVQSENIDPWTRKPVKDNHLVLKERVDPWVRKSIQDNVHTTDKDSFNDIVFKNIRRAKEQSKKKAKLLLGDGSFLGNNTKYEKNCVASSDNAINENFVKNEISKIIPVDSFNLEYVVQPPEKSVQQNSSSIELSISKYNLEMREELNNDFNLNKKTSIPMKRKISEISNSQPKENFKKMTFIGKAPLMNLEPYLNDNKENQSTTHNPVDSNDKIDAPLSIEETASKRARLLVPVAQKREYRHSSGNFVKLNLKYKGICTKATGKQRATRNLIKKTKWNNKMRGFGKCFNCGEQGHYSTNCPTRTKYGPKDEKAERNALGFVDYTEAASIDDFKFQNLEQLKTQTDRESLLCPVEDNQSNSIFSITNEDDLKECLGKSLKIFGFRSFRDKQEQIIRRVCAGKSTLAVLPTGSGKSLCYQIPAYIFQQLTNSVALIISPLISLMQDQLAKLPSGVKGVTLNSTLKFEDRVRILEEINKLEYAFILLSPEALVECNWISSDKLPPISFACIDEVHCLSDWSHHFRPSYLRVCKMLRNKYHVKCFLGLSATCSGSTIHNVSSTLRIDTVADPDCLIREIPIPDNITISVINVSNRDKALLKLFKKAPFDTCASILIYCSSREEATYLASLIRDRMESAEPLVGKKKLSWSAHAYHAGLSSAERAKIQRMFMRGRTRVLVATIAFGMGLDKPDIRAVIHYSRPKSFENYVQEVGRAGRDGLPAHALVLALKDEMLVQEAEELNDLNRHTFANHVELVTVKRFVRFIFQELPSYSNQCLNQCNGHICGFSPSEIALRFNIREETLMTLLCYLELMEPRPEPVLRLLPANYRHCNISCYGGPKQAAKLSHQLLPVSVVLTEQHTHQSLDPASTRTIHVDMIDQWNRYGFDVAVFRRELKALEWEKFIDPYDNKTRYTSTGVVNEFLEWNWIFAVRCNIDQEYLDEIVHHLHERLSSLESSTINDIERLHHLLKANSTELVNFSENLHCTDLTTKSTTIRNEIIAYFSDDRRPVSIDYANLKKQYSQSMENEARSHIRSFINQFKDNHELSSRSIASVLHGIDCPKFPSLFWRSQKTFWKSLITIDFITLMNWSNEELRFLL